MKQISCSSFFSQSGEYRSFRPSILSLQLTVSFLYDSHYTGRAVLPPQFVTVTDKAEFPSKAVRGPSAFPVAHLSSAFNVTVVEPRYVRHAQAHLLGQSTLDPKRGREDPEWSKLSRREKKAREDIAMALTKTSEIGELQTFSTIRQRAKC
jgi:hypothetical protein